MDSYFNCRYVDVDNSCAVEERINRILTKCYKECTNYNKCINCNGYQYEHFGSCKDCKLSDKKKYNR